MVKIQSSGPSETGPEFKPGSYQYKADNYKSGPYKDPLKQSGYKPSDNKVGQSSYEYKPYKPSHVGLWGDKPKEKKERKPPPPPEPRKIRRPRRTYECYRNPTGPDLKLHDVGPEYEVKDYEITEYKPYQADLKRPKSAIDPIKARPLYFTDKPIGIYEGNIEYKLDETNNVAMRHWHYDHIDDTVAAYGTEPSEDKYKVERKPKRKKEPKKKPEKKKEEPKKEEPKPKESKPEERVEPKPVIAAAIIPVQRANSPPRKKTFTSSSTQHVEPDMKTGTTQTQANKMKTSQTQYEPMKTKAIATQYESNKTQTVSIQTTPTQSPLPAVVVPLKSNAPAKKVKTKSEGVQCSEDPKKVVVRGTQSDGPSVRVMNTQTSPLPTIAPIIAPVPVRQRSPPQYYAEERHEETPVYRAPSRRSPSPTIVPVVVAPVQSRRSPSPRLRSPSPKRRSPTPKQRTPSPKYGTPTPQHVESPRRNSPPLIVPVVAPTSYRRALTPKQKTPSPRRRSPTPKRKEQTPPPKTQTPPRKEPSSIRPESDSRWTPSPEVPAPIPIVATAPPPVSLPKQRKPDSPAKGNTPKPVAARQPSPKATAKQETPKPQVTREPSPKASSRAPGAFPYPSTTSRLPPEVTACIEAYDCVHGPNNAAPSVSRSINMI